jgi:hypothetical protein
MSDRTYEIVRRQALAMNARFFEVSLIKLSMIPGKYRGRVARFDSVVEIPKRG